MQQEFWPYCLACLEQELPAQQFNTWIKPLPVECAADNGDGCPCLTLKAPNRFVLQWVRDRYMRRIGELGEKFYGMPLRLDLQLAPEPATTTTPAASPAALITVTNNDTAAAEPKPPSSSVVELLPVPEASAKTAPGATGTELAYKKTSLNPDFTFETLVTGRANDLARAAAMQVAENPGTSYNPLFIYGGVGLGKTHLVHAIGNAVFQRNPRTVVRYVHSEDFGNDVVRAYRQKSF
ncbi:MAG: DnaA/Hda family protein, partial [Betaproteobacteria bacterium]|nr:DnaA/Hda family protein [Betaproteobacteria bacterium]